MLEKILNKVLSGKFVLTVICGFVFAYSAYARVLSAEAIGTILTCVFISYFRKPEEKNNGSDPS